MEKDRLKFELLLKSIRQALLMIVNSIEVYLDMPREKRKVIIK